MAKSYQHLDLQERALIETQLAFGMRPGAIAAGLMRARSTVICGKQRSGLGRGMLSPIALTPQAGCELRSCVLFAIRWLPLQRSRAHDPPEALLGL